MILWVGEDRNNKRNKTNQKKKLIILQWIIIKNQKKKLTKIDKPLQKIRMKKIYNNQLKRKLKQNKNLNSISK